MKFSFPLFSLAFALCATEASAEKIVINGRYVVEKETVRGYFYRRGEQQTVFDVRWSDWSTRYGCQDVYDRARVEAALLNLVIELNEARSMDFGDFLKAQGFEGCEKF